MLVNRQWVTEQGRADRLPLAIQEVGSHWSRTAQVDVVAVNWTERAILLGKCKWGTDAVDQAVVRELLEARTPRVLKELPEDGAGWRVHHAFFARAGFTEAAWAEARAAGAQMVDLATLDSDLRHTLANP